MPNKYRKTSNHYAFSRPVKMRGERAKQSRKYFLQKKTSRIRFFLLIILILLAIGLTLYFLFFSKFSQIKNIKISKIKDNYLMSEQELKETIASLTNKKTLIFSQNNIILFRTIDLEKILKNDSRIETLEIEKDWPDTLIIKIKESEPVASLISFANNKNCYLNSLGQVIYASAKNFHDLPTFYDQTEVDLADPSYVKLLKDVLSLIKCDILTQNNIKADLVKISEKAGIFEVEITTSEHWRILINSEADFDQQTGSLGLILKEKIKDREQLEHIDLRFGEKIFYL